jgi:predicted O-methyltransferase YrrM
MQTDMRPLYREYRGLERVETEGRHRLRVRLSVLRLAPKGGVGAEIGVFTGIFSEVLAEVTEPRKLYLVDPWEKLHGLRFPNWGQYTAKQQLETKVALAAVQHRIKFLSPECEVVQDFSDNWLAKFSEPFLDWAYLDASHTYDYTLRTLHLLSDRLKSGGVLMGDDCWVKGGHSYNDVYRAIQVFLASSEFEMIHLDQNGQWAITRKNNTDRPDIYEK